MSQQMRDTNERDLFTVPMARGTKKKYEGGRNVHEMHQIDKLKKNKFKHLLAFSLKGNLTNWLNLLTELDDWQVWPQTCADKGSA